MSKGRGCLSDILAGPADLSLSKAGVTGVAIKGKITVRRKARESPLAEDLTLEGSCRSTGLCQMTTSGALRIRIAQREGRFRDRREVWASDLGVSHWALTVMASYDIPIWRVGSFLKAEDW